LGTDAGFRDPSPHWGEGRVRGNAGTCARDADAGTGTDADTDADADTDTDADTVTALRIP
jgi:hypothetical protein